MAVTPDTQVTLLKCPIELDNMNQLTFSDTTAQYNYFNSLPKLTETNFTYQRKDGVIRFPGHIDSLLEYNYVMYQNTHYSNKWFYCFISRMEYVNDSLTLIYIKTDVYQTWQHSLTFKQSFVEREHVSNDNIGAHTVEECLELGDFVINGSPFTLSNLNNTVIGVACVAVVNINDDGTVPDKNNRVYSYGGHLLGDTYNGLKYLAFRKDTQGLNGLRNLMQAYIDDGLLSYLIAIFMLPSNFIDNWSASKHAGLIDVGNVMQGNFSISRNTTLNGYTPKNNKMYTSPFNYILVDNNAGGNVKYEYEYFLNGSNPSFNYYINLGIGCSGILVPVSYKNVGSDVPNFNEMFILGKYATCPWTGDTYTNWLSQNSINIGVQSLVNAGQIVIGAASMMTPGAGTVGGAAMISSGVGGIMNTLEQVHQASFMPPQVNGDVTAGDVISALAKNAPVVYNMSIKAEKAQIIDKFFTMYGYKINTLKVPNRHTRRYWNYVKTIDVNIEADIPQEDLQEIKNMFNNGITLWHDASHFLDYSQNNSIVV